MNKRMLVCLSLVFLFAGASGQDYAFRVLVNKGKNEVRTGDNWQPIKVGASISSKDEIKVTENAYVGLIHVSGKPLELKDAGKYKVTDLSARIGPGSSVINKYTDFILSSNTEKKNRLTATGAVNRGGANTIKLYNNKVIVNWEKDKGTPPFVVTFKSMFGEELKQEEVQGYDIVIDLDDASFANEDNILVDVYVKGDKNKVSETFTLKKLSRADKDRIKNSLNEFRKDVTDETAINKLLLAGFYEQNNLIIDAATAYQEAIKLAPDVATFQEDYENFLLRHGLKELPPRKEGLKRKEMGKAV
jgi:hypothetical protein